MSLRGRLLRAVPIRHGAICLITEQLHYGRAGRGTAPGTMCFSAISATGSTVLWEELFRMNAIRDFAITVFSRVPQEICGS